MVLVNGNYLQKCYPTFLPSFSKTPLSSMAGELHLVDIKENCKGGWSSLSFQGLTRDYSTGATACVANDIFCVIVMWTENRPSSSVLWGEINYVYVYYRNGIEEKQKQATHMFSYNGAVSWLHYFALWKTKLNFISSDAQFCLNVLCCV